MLLKCGFLEELMRNSKLEMILKFELRPTVGIVIQTMSSG